MATTKAETSEINFVKVGAVAAIVMAISAFVFFAIFNTLSTADARTEQFLSDVAANQGAAAMVPWLNGWLGILTVPVYLGLYYGLRRSSQSYMLLALMAGLAWGVVLVVVTPLMLTLLSYVAPAWAASSDSAARDGLMITGTTLGWVINTTIGGLVFFLRALSVLAASRVMFLLGGWFWTGLGWLGIVFAIEHAIAGIQRIAVVGSGGAAGSTLLGAISGVLLFVWLVGVGIGLLRLRSETETSAIADSQRHSQPAPIPAERVG
jgi:hypothetical protein